MMNEKCAVFRDEDGLTEAHEIVQPPQGGGRRSPTIDDRGTVFNQDVLGAIELGYMLDCAECIVVGALERKESRGAQFRARLPRAQRRRVAQAHHLSRQRRRRARRSSYSPVTITQWEPQERTY